MLEIRNLSKRFASPRSNSQSSNALAALSDFNLTVKSGEFFSLLGPSGCGKTTLMRIVAGFESPCSGSILFDGQDLMALPAQKRPLNMVFQRYALFPHLNVFDNIAFGLRMRRLGVSEIARKVDEIARSLSLMNLLKRPVTHLSGGECQRVALARALVNKPKLILLDEPFSALDQHLRQQIHREVRALQKQLGITFFLVTHDQHEAMVLSDRIAVMHAGRLQQVGTPENIYSEPENAWVMGFFGQSHRWQGQVLESNNNEVLVLTDFGQKLKAKNSKALGVGATVDILFRWEDVQVTAASANRDQNLLSAQFINRRNLGVLDEIEWRLNNGGPILHSLADAKTSLSLQDAQLQLDSQKIRVYLRDKIANA